MCSLALALYCISYAYIRLKNLCIGTKDKTSEVRNVNYTVNIKDSSQVSGFVAAQMWVGQLINFYYQPRGTTKGQ